MLAARAWKEFFEGGGGGMKLLPAGFAPDHFNGPVTAGPVDEFNVSTNMAAGFGLSAIACLGLVPEALPAQPHPMTGANGLSGKPLPPPTMTRPPRYALIGATRIGAFIFEAIREMEKDGLAHLTSRRGRRAGRCLRPANPPGGGRGALLPGAPGNAWDESALDVIVIATPIPFHLRMTLDCLERDVFIYLEKPPVPLVQQWEALRARRTTACRRRLSDDQFLVGQTTQGRRRRRPFRARGRNSHRRVLAAP